MQSAPRAAESFRDLVLRHRGRTGLTQRQLAARMGVSRGAVQDWEAGVSYPDAHHLQALIVAFVEADGLMSGYESAEAEAMWTAVLREAPRMQTPFDAAWWAAVMTRQAGSAVGDAKPGQAAAVARRWAVPATIQRDYPDIQIVAQQGMPTPPAPKMPQSPC